MNDLNIIKIFLGLLELGEEFRGGPEDESIFGGKGELNQHEINKQICKVLNQIMIRNPTTQKMMDEQKKLIEMVMGDICGDCWAKRDHPYLQCMANDKFRETCLASLFKEKDGK